MKSRREGGGGAWGESSPEAVLHSVAGLVRGAPGGVAGLDRVGRPGRLREHKSWHPTRPVFTGDPRAKELEAPWLPDPQMSLRFHLALQTRVSGPAPRLWSL